MRKTIAKAFGLDAATQIASFVGCPPRILSKGPACGKLLQSFGLGYRDMSKYQRIGIRIAIATNVGVIVAAIALVVAWRDSGDMSEVRPEQWATRQAMGEIDGLIQIYRNATKTLPRSLEGLRRSDESWVHFQRNERGVPLDGWGRPFLYSTDGGKYVITSLGRDDKPGGIGLDCDLSSTDEWPKEAVPTFSQFLVHPVARGIVSACLACGVLAFLVSLVTVNPPALHGWAIPSLIVKLAFTILGALFIAFIMSIAEIPNYH